MGIQPNNSKKLYGTATVGSKGQVVIPAEAREELGLQSGDRLYVLGGNAFRRYRLAKRRNA